MLNKKLAEFLIRTTFTQTSNTPTFDTPTQKKSYLIPFEGEVTKRFMKIASSTYVDLSEPEKVWRLEVLEGKPYIVALEKSNILHTEDYDVHDAVQGIMLYKGDRVIANIPLPPTADAKAIATRLKEKVSSLNHLPPQLMVEVITKEASLLSNTFINMTEYQTKVAAKKKEQPATQSLYEYVKSIKPVLPPDMGSRFEAAITTLKGDQKKINLVQHIVDSYERLIRAIQRNSPTIHYIAQSMGIDTLELEDILAELGREVKAYLDKLFISRLVIAAESPDVEAFRTLFADLFVGLGQIKNAITSIVGYTTQPEGPSFPGAELIRRRRVTEMEEGGEATGSAVSLQEQLAAIISSGGKEPQATYEVMKGKVLDELASQAERLQSVLNAGAKKVGSFSELRSRLVDELIPETVSASRFVLKLVSRRPANNKIRIFNERIYAMAEDYLESTNLLSGISTELKDALSFSYRATSEIFVNLPHSGQSLSGSPFSLSRPSEKEKGMLMTTRSRELAQFESVVRATQLAAEILNDARKGRSEEEKELVAQESNLKRALTIAEQILARLQQQLARQIPPKVVLKDLSTQMEGLQKLHDILSDVLPLASSVRPERLPPQLVSQILVSILPVLIDPTFYKTEALFQFIKLAVGSPIFSESLIGALSVSISKIEEFYRAWVRFESDANAFLAAVEQGKSLLGEIEEEESLESGLFQPVPQTLPIAAALKQILKTAAPEGLSLEQVLQRDIDAAKAQRVMYSQLFNALNTAMPRDTVIRALKGIGIRGVDSVVEKMPNRLYGRFLSTLLGNLGEMFTPGETQVAIPSSGRGSVQVETEFAPGMPLTRGPQAAKELLSAIGIPEIYIDVIRDISYQPQLGVTMDMPREVKKEIRKETPLTGEPGMTPEYSLPEEEKLIFPETPKPSLFVPEIDWGTFSQLYPRLKPVLEGLGTSLEDQVVSLYQAVKSPVGHQLIKSLRDAKFVAPLYFYETQKTTAEDVIRLSNKKVIDALTRKGIQANPVVVKSIARTFFFENPEQARQAAESWKKYVSELAETYSTPVKFIEPSLQEKVKEYFADPAHMMSFMTDLANTGVHQLVSAAKGESETGDKLRKGLRKGDLASVMSLFSGQAAYVLREQLDKVLSTLGRIPEKQITPSRNPSQKQEA